MVEVLFGTFSNLPFAADALKVVKTVMGVTDFLSKVGDQITRGAISFFGWVAKQLSDDSAKDGIDKVQNLLLAANDVQAKDWANAGRIMYVERVIVKTLEDKLKSDIGRHGPKVLPHHTLLAKDQDTGQPECRLGFKIATLLAVDLTAQVLEQYLTGGDMKAVEVVLRNRIRYPEMLLKDNPNIAAAFQNVVPTIYGERWWQVAGNSQAEMILR